MHLRCADRTLVGAEGLLPALITVGVCSIVKDDDGKVVLDKKGEPVRQAKYRGLAFAPAFLCVMVHQPEGRWGSGIAGEDRAGAAWPRVHHHDDGHLRTSVSARRRRCRACHRGDAPVRLTAPCRDKAAIYAMISMHVYET
jgi:hypothetical protein